MSSDEPTVTVDGSTEPPTSEPADDKPATKPSRARKAKEPKAKKAPAPKKLRPRSPSAHPPYEEVTFRNTRFNFCFNICFFFEFWIWFLFFLIFVDGQGCYSDIEREDRFEPVRDYQVSWRETQTTAIEF